MGLTDGCTTRDAMHNGPPNRMAAQETCAHLEAITVSAQQNSIVYTMSKNSSA